MQDSDPIPFIAYGVTGPSKDGKYVTFGLVDMDKRLHRFSCETDLLPDLLNELVRLLGRANELREYSLPEPGTQQYGLISTVVSCSGGVTEQGLPLLLLLTGATTELRLSLTQEALSQFDNALVS